MRPDARGRAGGGGGPGGRCLGRDRRTGQQCRLWGDRAVSGEQLRGLDADAGVERHGAGDGLQGGGAGDARAAVGADRQHHLAGVADGAAGLHRLHGEQGRGGFDYPGAGGGAGAVWRAGQQPGAGDDGHRDAALDRGGLWRGRPGARICRRFSTSGRGGCRWGGGRRSPRSRLRWSGLRSTLPLT